MLNFNKLKNNFIKYKNLFKKRNFNLNIRLIKNIYLKINKLQKRIEYIQKQRNKINKIFNKSKINLFKINFINNFLKKNKPILLKYKLYLKNYLLNIPNIPDNTILKLKKNKIVKKWGNIINFNFKIKNHIELGNQYKKCLDFVTATKLTKSKFSLIKEDLAKLHRILGQFMIDYHIKNHNYKEFYLPYIVNKDSLIATGQLPKFKNEIFYIFTNNNFNKKYALIPTGEVPLINIVRNITFNENELPLKFISLTPCFRVEAGSYGKINRGLSRLHQFEKVELIQITNQKKSNFILKEMTFHAEKILQLLKLPYRKILLSSNDINFSSSKTYDLEVWIPSINNYLEVSSCSNTKDFQSRRLNAKYKTINKKIRFVHILNASGLAIGRILISIMENYQDKDGNILIPKILLPYFYGKKKILLNNKKY